MSPLQCSLCSHLPKNCSHVDLTATIYFPEWRKRDTENFAATLWKMTNDALVDMGIIPDDTPDHITTHNPEIIVDNQVAPLTELKIVVSK